MLSITRKIWSVAVLLLTLLASTGWGRIIIVDDDGPADFNTRPSQQLQSLLSAGILYSTRTLLNIDEGIDDILVSETLLARRILSQQFATVAVPASQSARQEPSS